MTDVEGLLRGLAPNVLGDVARRYGNFDDAEDALHEALVAAAGPQILALYGLLERITDSPIVTLNRAVAVAIVEGPAAGLSALDGLDAQLPGHHRLDAVRGHLLEMSGDHDAAIAHYRAAAGRTTSTAERDDLTMRAARLSGGATALPGQDGGTGRGPPSSVQAGGE